MPARILPFPPTQAESTPTPTRAPKPCDAAAAALEDALATGIRGSARDAVLEALRVIREPKGRDRTDAEYRALRPGTKLVDPARPGFLARANQRGVRFTYRHKDPVDGRQVETAIGYLGEVSLSQARETWETLRAQRMGGARPALPTAPTASPLPTLRELIARFEADYVRLVQRPRSQQETMRLLHRHIVPVFGDLPADALDRDALVALLSDLSAIPRERDKLRVALSTMFNVATGRTKKVMFKTPWLPISFANPVATVQTPEHNSVGYGSSAAEILRYASALPSADIREVSRDALLLQLLCASRIREVTDLEWSEVEHDEWLLPAARSKNGREHRVFLSAPALEVLRRRAQWRADADRFVFPSPGDRSKPIRSDLVMRALAANREALGVSAPFTSHSVRHAFRTWAAEAGYGVDVVNRCTAHVFASGINSNYNHAALNGPARALWAAWGEYLS